MIYTALATILFVLGISLTGVESWGTANWWLGMLSGLTLALVWHANRSTTRVLGMLGLPLLLATALGLGSNLAQDARSFFNGMSLAMPLGFAISAWWRWNSFRPQLIRIARIENVQWLLRLLGERT